MPDPYAILEISLHLWAEDYYSVYLRFFSSRADVDQGEEIVGLPLTNLARARFLELQNDLPEYGRRLQESLFASPRARDIFQTALTTAHNGEVPLQVQLALSPSMPFLHDLRWELLRDPIDDRPLFTRDDILFSRRLISPDSRPIRPRSRDEVSVLVVIANPSNLKADWSLAPIDEEAELERVADGLAGLRTEHLRSKDHPVTLDHILDRLTAEQYDALYLVCHGAIVRGEPRLWLEDDHGRAVVVSGIGFAARLMEIAARPRLVMLVSCQSAGTGDDAGRAPEGALLALGPRLIRAGIPAVIAMAGDVSMGAMRRFLPAFFGSLRQDGRIDLAMTRGRARIQDTDEAWVPVLFMRTNRGLLWTQPRREPADRFPWDALMNQIRNSQCTPVLGSGLTDHLFGSRREVAQRWASGYR
jgi:hypothetical protein